MKSAFAATETELKKGITLMFGLVTDPFALISPASKTRNSRIAIVEIDTDAEALMIFVIAASAAEVVAAADAENAISFVISALAVVVAVALALTSIFFVRLAGAESVKAVAFAAIAMIFVRLADASTI